MVRYLLLGLILLWGSEGHAGTLTIEECLQLAQQNNPGWKGVQLQRAEAAADLAAARSGYWPTVDARAGYTVQAAEQAIIAGGRAQPTQQQGYPFWTLAAEQTLYDFGRTGSRIERSSAQVAVVQAEVDNYRQDLWLAVVAAYYRVLIEEKLLEAAREEVTQMSEHRRVAAALHQEGMVTRNDLLQAEVKLAGSRQQQLVRENGLDVAWLLLNSLLGRAAELRDTLAAPTATAGADFDSRRHPQLAAGRARVDAAAAEQRQSRSRFWPQLYLRGEANYVENEYVREQTILSGTLGLRVNLFDGFASSAAMLRAATARQEAVAQLDEVTRRLRLDYETARHDATTAAARVELLQASLQAGEENLRINQERYQAQTGTASDVIDAQSLLSQTRSDYWQAVYEEQLALARVHRASGQL